ncbi:DEAD/DEAH box helicase family protein [Dietzia cinnamea]|uniref:DEAD/DEAH box helicase n=1 Tax=Dietzia cinnamea TaxID=321318 RepID=UPI0021A9495A|nr:DEAD/DEAH box helicase family protein [Dietzia cinnamea]MCT1884728.1 DEAD/DEAH box helicase family protein [Dietzia cinnamea]
MSKPNISTYRRITPLIYSWSTPDIPKYAGWEKIGYTEEQTADARIAQQASQLGIAKNKVWAFQATYMTEGGGRFTDRDFHSFLKQRGIERELQPKRTEWHRFDDEPKTSRELFFEFASQDFSGLQTSGHDDYVLRPEQRAAVEHAMEAFAEGHGEVLWNAKPRFGKTLTTYDLMRQLDVIKVLIVTNRPAIANSWYDDFERFIGHQTDFKFVSESPSLDSRAPMARSQWSFQLIEHPDARIVEFVSLQDLKGSEYFGGIYRKLKHIADYDWDLLVIDEAHDGVDTTKTDVAFDKIKRKYTLHLSGTPFRALESGKFGPKQIYNWTYQDEREAMEAWDDASADNPYAPLPKLNMLTYQVSRMITDQLALGVAVEEGEANIDYAFDLNEFFATKDNGFFEHEADIIKFLDCLTTNEKYPFSTPELRDEIRHSFWLLNRVASAKALQNLLGKHEVFKDYTVVLAAGDGRAVDDDSDTAAVGKSLDAVRKAIDAAEAVGGKTITLSVGQLTTGVTIPEWTAVIMLSNLSSPALYMQAAFRAQNPYTYERGGQVMQKQNAYIFDFAPERTLTIYDAFANNLSATPALTSLDRQEKIRRLLNFFPVIGEDSEGRMVELDATQVLTFPQVYKAREVVRRGFLSNLLFNNVAGIFRYTEHVKEILDKLPVAKAGKLKTGDPLAMPDPPVDVDDQGNAQVDTDTVINPKVAELGKPVWSTEDVADVEPDEPIKKTGDIVAKLVTEKSRETREKLKEAYNLTNSQVERDTKATEARVRAEVERKATEHKIAQRHLKDELEEAATEAEAEKAKAKLAEHEATFAQEITKLAAAITDSITEEVVTREETKKEQKRADDAMDDARSHLRGFARTIPMFLMAYGDPDMRLANFDDYTPDDVFEEITGISEAEFRILRDGQEVTEEDGTVVAIPGMFDEAVFDQSVQEFLLKKAELADYFDDSLTENIFAYVPQQKTSLVFTPQAVVTMMVDQFAEQNPGIFADPDKTFADLFSTAGLFIMELVRRLDTGLAKTIPDQDERLKHILTSQVYEMSHNEILHRITIEAVSGGVEERKRWIEESGHFKVGNLAKMTPAERQATVEAMLNGSN